MSAAFTFILRVLRSPWFWVALVSVLLAVLIVNKWGQISAMLQRVLGKDGGDYEAGLTDGAGNSVQGDEADERRNELKALAETLYAKIHGIPWNWGPAFDTRDAVLRELLTLNDTELKYAAQQYKLRSREETMYAAIDNEVMPFTDLDERILARLANINMT